MSHPRIPGAGSIAAVLSHPYGRRIALAPFDEAAFSTRFDEHHREVKGALAEAKTTADGNTKTLGELSLRLTDVEQKMALRPGNSNMVYRADGSMVLTGGTPGQTFTTSEDFKTFAKDLRVGRVAQVEVKTITSVPTSAGAMAAPDVRTDAVALPQRRLTVRDLIAPGTTEAGVVWYPQMTARTNNAATVAENPSAPKPQSEFTLVQQQAYVRTIAHFIVVSRQIMDDAPGLSSLIDSELRYGLAEVEDRQLLMGDGTGTNLLGLIPQATAFAKPAGIVLPSTVTQLDRLLIAFAQAELAFLPATGVVLNPIDYTNILMLKDTTGRYIGGGPLEQLAEAFWNVPKAVTTVMPVGNFLVGAFKDGAQVFDRQQASVLASTEDRDNFVKNLVTVLAEERLAFAVKRPSAFIYGSFGSTLT